MKYSVFQRQLFLPTRRHRNPGGFPVFPVSVYGLPAGDGTEKGGVRAFTGVITVAVKIKFQKGVVDTFFDIFGIFQTGRGCLPHKGSILFHELFRSGKS